MSTIESVNKKLGFDFRTDKGNWAITECDDPIKDPYNVLNDEDYDFLEKYYGI